MHYDGMTFRPPYEAHSVLLQVTKGCSHNACRFCTMYRGQRFDRSPIREIESDIMEAAYLMPWAERVFLENGDAFCLSADELLEIADLIHEYMPQIRTITGYARIQNIADKTDEGLIDLAKAGYGQLNIGLESGLDDVLAWMNKGYDLDTARRQLLRLREAGIAFSLNIINAAAGPGRMLESAEANAKICNETQPYLIFVSPLHVDPGSMLERDVAEGRFIESPLGAYIDEEIAFVEHLELDQTVFFGMHVSNPIPVSGLLPHDKDLVLERLRRGKAQFSEELLNSHPSKGAEGRLLI